MGENHLICFSCLKVSEMSSRDSGERQVCLKRDVAHPKIGGRNSAGDVHVSLDYGENLDLTYRQVK